NPLDENELNKLFINSKQNNHPLVFMNEKTMKASVQYHPFIQDSLGSLNFPHPEDDASFYVNRKMYQSLLFCENKNEELYFSNYPKFDFIRWHPYSVDVLPMGGSKAEGIKKMIERLGFKMEDVYAFGDGLNDLEMLKAVGTGVSMGNGVTEAKELADFVTSDVSEDGIWNGLKELQLI
ncbi:MAG: HAD hydrolase family protein, partial [Bacillus sp. (in: firmicutes)]